MNLISFLATIDENHVSEMIFANGLIVIQFSWTINMLQFREYTRIVKEYKVTDVTVKFNTFTIIIAN